MEVTLATYIADLSTIVTKVLVWSGEVLDFIVSNPPILVPFGIIVLGASINVLKRVF